MSLKDLFSNTSGQVVINKSLEDLNREAQTENYLDSLTENNERYLPKIDFSDPANFARYGSAEKYYVDGIKNVYQHYPYDGSKKEKLDWRNRASQIDLYILDNIYPKSVGYVNLSSSVGLATVANLRSSSLPQYVSIKGGPNASSTGQFSLSNVYDPANNRESNLSINSFGNTVEFWFRDEVTSSNANYSSSYALFDLWNNVTASSADYSRLVITKINGSNKFAVTYRSGSSGITNQTIDYTFDSSEWHHYAFTFSPFNTTDLIVSLYVDGTLAKSEQYSSSAISSANNNNAIAYIGALRASVVSANSSQQGMGVSYGSYDEFRFWKKCRNPQEIYRNWFLSVDGGSNTDDSNVDLGVYLKFNEGIINTLSINEIDKICIDYSGRISNGTLVNYSIGTKVTSSAIDEYFGATKEEKDIIIFSSNPLVQQVIATYGDIGYAYDQTNISSIYKSLPSWITEENEKQELEDLPSLIQIISSYFDTLHIQIENINKIKNVEYTTDSEKPKPFAKQLLTSHGFDNLELFTDTTFLEKVLSRNEDTQFEKNLSDIKNTIYQNIYNNLAYIYKSKGTEKSLRNLIRCFGVDDELIKINLYSDNTTYDLTDKFIYSSVAKKFVDFNNPDRYDGYVYQKRKLTDLTNTKSYIPSNDLGLLDYIPVSVQAEIIFPKQLPIESSGYFTVDFVTSSLFGAHTADQDDSNYTWGNDEFNFQVYSVREKIGSPNAYFLATGSFSGSAFALTSSIYKDVYDNQKWNLALKIKPNKYDQTNIASGSQVTDYSVEFVGYNSLADSVDNVFNISTAISQSNMVGALRKHKRLYVGSHYQDFDNTQLLCKTDVKISSLRFWYDYLTDEEVKLHSFESTNFGRSNPNWNPDYFLSIMSSRSFTKSDTLALNWDFSNVSSSDSNGQFIVEDLSSGSLEEAMSNRLGWFSLYVGYQYPGFGDEFLQNDDQVVNKEYVLSAKKQNPEIVSGNDLVQTPDTDDVNRTKDSKAIIYYLSIEKSMSQVINDEIMNWFATIKGYNNLIGEPAERYKAEYSGLRQMREVFFKNIGSTLNFEKFFEFYKWIDSSLSMIIGQLIPLSSNASTKVRNMVESHMLERSKYENKTPTIEFKGEAKSYPIVSHLQYNYKEQAAYPNNLNSEVTISRYYTDKPLWLKQRIQRGDALVSSSLEPQNDVDREIIRQVINQNNIDGLPTLFSSDVAYEGRSDVSRIFTKTYRIIGDTLYNLEDTLTFGNISNNRINSQFQFASSSVTGSGQIVQPLVKKGNYLNTYEFVQMSSRTNNNKSFVDLTGSIFAASGTNVLGFTDRTLPERAIYKNIFVERFSAPGGPETLSRGALDKNAEEYSAYNSLNYRNFRVRSNLNKWLAETSSIDSENPSLHKYPDNVARYPGDDNNSYTNTQNDNAFISHAIPRSDYQYAWITSSMDSNNLFSGYSSKYSNLNIQYTFVSGNVSGSSIVDFVGLNTTMPKTVDTSSNTLSSVDSVTDMNKYLSNINGPYQHPSWKQIRGGETLLSRVSKKNNKILVQDTPILKTKIVNNSVVPYIERISQTFTSYKEMPVSFNKPMTHVVDISGSDSLIETLSTYDNNKEKFSNEQLGNILGIDAKETPQYHDVLNNLQEGLFEPKPEIVEIKYENMAYPSNEYIGSADVRLRTDYEDWDGNTGSVVNTRTFWRNDSAERARAVTTKDVYDILETTFEALPNEQNLIIYNDEYNHYNTISNINNFRESILAQDLVQDRNSYTQSANHLSTLVANKVLSFNNLSEISRMSAGLNGTVLSIVSGSNKVYAGGEFLNQAVSGSRVSQWDGSSWSPIGNGLNGTVRALTSGSNRVYAGGSFTDQAISGSRVSQWDGSSWSPMGNGLDGTVQAIISGSNRVYAGGDFTIVTSGSDVSQWDGTSWSPMGGGLTNTVYALSSGSNRVYAAGDFASSVSGTGISQWDGTNWSPMGGGLPVFSPLRSVLCLLSGSNRVYAGGFFLSTVSGSNISQWDGTSWSALGSGINGIVNNLFSNSSGLYAVGNFSIAGGKPVSNIARWDGTEWYNISVGFNTTCRALSYGNNTFYAGGDFTNINGNENYYVSKLNENSWSTVGSGLTNIVRTLAYGSNRIYAGGDFINQQLNGSRVSQWDGSSWSPIGNGLNGTVRALTSGSNRVYAGGNFTNQAISGAYVSQWDGTSWSPMGGGLNNVVYTLTSGSNRVYAGGNFTNQAISGSRVSQWDGTSWSPMGDGLDNTVYALASGSNRVYAGGGFNSVASGSYISQWDGIAWSPVFSSSPNNLIYSIFSGSDGLYFGGVFSKIGQQTYNYIAKWDGNTISRLGSGLNATVRSLFSNSSGLYAGGEFTTAGGNEAKYIARWDGFNWHKVKTGFNSIVYSIISGSDGIHAGGAFTSAGEIINTNIEYDYYIKGDVAKNNLVENSYYIKNNIFYPLDGLATYDIKQKNLYNINNNLETVEILDSSENIIVLTSGSDGLYVGGSFTSLEGSTYGYVARRTGTAWSPMGGGLNDTVQAIISGSNRVYAGGNFTNQAVSGAGVSQWDGTNWSPMGDGLQSFIYVLASGSNRVYAGGNFITVGSGSCISQWDGTSWSPMGGGLDIAVYTIASGSNRVYAGGDFITVGSGSRVSQWDGTNWSPMGDGLNGTVYALTSGSNRVYAGGYFNSVASGSYVSQWDGNSWSALSYGLNGIVRSLFSNSSGLYVGGDFTSGSNSGTSIKLNRIAKWNGTSWEQINNNGDRSGFALASNETVYSIIGDENKLTIAGTFTGTRSGPYIKPKTSNNYVEGYKADKLLIPTPQLTHNNFIPPSYGSTNGMKISEVTYNTSSNIASITNYTSSERINILNDSYVYEVDEKSGKTPFFNSYLEYLGDIKAQTQKYSIIPEYKISDYVKKYVKEKNGNFNSILNEDYLTLNGALQATDFTDVNNSINISNNLKPDLIFDNSKDNANVNLNFKISGIKKLLPYRGFYPSERIVNLSNYFINSFLNLETALTSEINVEEIYSSSLSNGTPINQQILTLLQPIMAPGILMNTIKSSIAVDYPTFIANSGTYDSETKPGFYAETGSNLITRQVYNSATGLYNNYTASNYINQEQNYRFPFESLIEFDTQVPQNLKNGNNNLYYLNPTYYTSDAITGSEYGLLVYPSYNMDTGSLKPFIFRDSNYKLAMHNFLAEIPNFFLNGKLTNIVSKPENEFNVAKQGTTYYMDVVLEKDSQYKEFITAPYYEALKDQPASHQDGTFLLPSPDSLYGPPTRYWNTASATPFFSRSPYNFYSKLLDTPAYAPYVPPYYYGKSIARISFTPADTRKYTLSEIQNSCSVEYLNTQADSLFAQRSNFISGNFSAPYGDNYSNTPAYKQMMKLSSSVNLFLSAKTKLTKIDPNTGKTVEVSDRESINSSWIIQTKFETPSINFINSDLSDNVGLKFLGGTKENGMVHGVYSHMFKGMWTTYGTPVSDGQGIKLYLDRSQVAGANVGSLIDLCGFGNVTDQKKTIGLIAERKKVTEGMVIIPYTLNKNHNENINDAYAETLPEILGENGIYRSSDRGNGPYYYKIDKKIISDYLGGIKLDAASFEQIKAAAEASAYGNNSIVKMIKSMTKFVIPPHLDWIRNKNIDPFVMYIAEFSTELEKQDLSDIWQGVMPKQSYTAEIDNLEINHKFEAGEMFHGKRPQGDTKFKVFKIKQSANINYYKLTDDSKDDNRFKFTFGNSQEATIPEYSYNWPYDFFSLVELVNIETSLHYKKPEEKETIINPNEILSALQEPDAISQKDKLDKLNKKAIPPRFKPKR